MNKNQIRRQFTTFLEKLVSKRFKDTVELKNFIKECTNLVIGNFDYQSGGERLPQCDFSITSSVKLAKDDYCDFTLFYLFDNAKKMYITEVSYDFTSFEDKNYTRCGRVFYDDKGKVIKIEKELCTWGIGNNGYIFYDQEAYETSLDKPCYAPEYADADDEYFTHQDFLDLCDGDEELARDLFDMVDWQYPESLLAEWEGSAITYCRGCGKIFKIYKSNSDERNERCPHCGALVETKDGKNNEPKEVK